MSKERRSLCSSFSNVINLHSVERQQRIGQHHHSESLLASVAPLLPSHPQQPFFISSLSSIPIKLNRAWCILPICTCSKDRTTPSKPQVILGFPLPTMSPRRPRCLSPLCHRVGGPIWQNCRTRLQLSQHAKCVSRRMLNACDRRPGADVLTLPGSGGAATRGQLLSSAGSSFQILEDCDAVRLCAGVLTYNSTPMTCRKSATKADAPLTMEMATLISIGRP